MLVAWEASVRWQSRKLWVLFPYPQPQTYWFNNNSWANFIYEISLLKITWPHIHRFISGLSILFHWTLHLFLCSYHIVYKIIALEYSLKPRNVMLSTCLKISLSIWGFLYCVCVLSHFSRVLLCATPWTVARQAPLSVGFSRQEWSGLPCPPPGDLPDPGIQPMSPMSPSLAGGFFTTSGTWEAQKEFSHSLKFFW